VNKGRIDRTARRTKVSARVAQLQVDHDTSLGDLYKVPAGAWYDRAARKYRGARKGARVKRFQKLPVVFHKVQVTCNLPA